ncbi:hypothetical protein [Croceicoccus gelatinilyticus]|uniref:hypothetical protein n=1 Tax=Croceicoccus gelatinilyticus TaxID=2835536 RepID=UPI001BD0107D|nr:hypothetical protein [Croceicoccus gelatinilyticus]MBS7671681.1 hypothetical protein [Croceicoccus gelatinilyticus]
MSAVLGALEMRGFYRVEPRHEDIAVAIMNREDRSEPLATAARAALSASGTDDTDLQKRAIALAAAELEGGRWEVPLESTREIAMHVLSNIRHQQLLGEKLEIIEREKLRGATVDDKMPHLGAFDAAIVRQMLRHPEREVALRAEAHGDYASLDASEQEKLLGDFECGVYLDSTEIHRIDLETLSVNNAGKGQGMPPGNPFDQGFGR